jgi:MFS family permease
LLGLWDIAFITLSSLVIFQIIQDESVVGITRSAMILITAISSFFAGKIMRKIKLSYLWGSISVSISIVCFAYLHDWFGIVILGLLSGLGAPFMNIALSTTALAGIDENKEQWNKKYHMFIERDGALGIARVISYGILLFLFSYFDKNQVAKNWIISISIFPLLLGLLTYSIKRNE